MDERCLLLVRPDGDLDARLVSIEEYSSWKPCQSPVVYRIPESLAPGGVMRLCEGHGSRLMRELEKRGLTVLTMVNE